MNRLDILLISSLPFSLSSLFSLIFFTPLLVWSFSSTLMTGWLVLLGVWLFSFLPIHSHPSSVLYPFPYSPFTLPIQTPFFFFSPTPSGVVFLFGWVLGVVCSYGLSSIPFTQCPIHFLPTLPNSTFLFFSHAIWCGLFFSNGLLLPHSPSVLYTYHFSPFKLPTQTSIFFSTLMSGWLVLMVSLVEWIFVVVSWFFLCCGVMVECFLWVSSTPFTQCTFNFLLPLT